MKACLIGLVLALIIITPAFGVDVELKWDPVSGATGYKVYRSIDNGTNCTVVTTEGVTGTTAKLPGQPEDRMILFRVSAYDSNSEAVRYWSGACYNHRLKPVAAPGGNSVP